MIRNQAAQTVSQGMIKLTDGSAFAGAVTVYVTVDNATETIGSVGSGLCTNEGNGLYTYRPSADETNGVLLGFTFTGSGAKTETLPIQTVTAAQMAALAVGSGPGVFTVRDLISLSLKRINKVQAGGTVNDEDARDAYLILNLWLDALSIERLLIPFIKRTTWTLASTKGTPTNPYTVGSGGDVDVPKPTYLDTINYLNNAVSPAVEIPLTPMTPEMYSGIPIKTLTATLPGAWSYQPTYSTGFGSLYFWAIPTQSNLQGVLYAPSALAQFRSLNDAVVVPAGYKKFLVDGLAIELSNTFKENIPIDPELKASVRSLKSTLKAANTPQLDMGFDPAYAVGYGGRSNIYTGWPS